MNTQHADMMYGLDNYHYDTECQCIDIPLQDRMWALVPTIKAHVGIHYAYSYRFTHFGTEVPFAHYYDTDWEEYKEIMTIMMDVAWNKFFTEYVHDPLHDLSGLQACWRLYNYRDGAVLRSRVENPRACIPAARDTFHAMMMHNIHQYTSPGSIGDIDCMIMIPFKEP